MSCFKHRFKNHSNYTVTEMNEIATTIIWLSQLFFAVQSELCGGFSPVYGMTLKRHVSQVLRVPNSLHCLKACNNDIRCQSVNHLMGKDLCELNNRTKEATPEILIWCTWHGLTEEVNMLYNVLVVIKIGGFSNSLSFWLIKLAHFHICWSVE